VIDTNTLEIIKTIEAHSQRVSRFFDLVIIDFRSMVVHPLAGFWPLCHQMKLLNYGIFLRTICLTLLKIILVMYFAC
jgi:hypothetical protein